MDKIKVQVLGRGDAFFSGGNNHSCIFIKYQKLGIMLDCGTTALKQLNKFSISSNEIDHILISHFHGDHIGGLPYLLLDAGINARRRKPLTIYTPKGGKEKIETLFSLLYPGSEQSIRSFPIKYEEYSTTKEVSEEKYSFKAYGMAHTRATHPHGLRLAIGDKVISYSGDSGYTEQLYPLAENADLFICECNFYDIEYKSHLNYKTIKGSNLFKSKRIVLTHLGAQMIKNFKKVDLEIAEEGKVIVL